MTNFLYKRTACASAIIAMMSSYSAIAAEALDAHNIETMVIKSTKLDTPLGELNSAVAVKTGEELETAGIYEVRDLQKAFPGLLLNSSGNRTYTRTSVRGITASDNYSTAVSLYVDGVLQDNSFLAQQLTNVERVELLRGPQGTLYGGNAQGGVINIITNKASEMSQFNAGILYSNLSQQLDLSGSGAINDSTYADISLRYVYDEGNISSTTSHQEDINDADERLLQARFHYLPEHSPLAVTLSISADHLDSHEELYLTEEEYNASESAYDDQELLRKVYTYSLSVDYDFGNTKLTSISAFQDREIEREYAYGDWEEEQQKLTQEIRLNTKVNESLTTLIGAYAEQRSLYVDTGSYYGVNDLDYKTYALFSQVNYDINESFDVTVGLRASYINVNSDFDSYGYYADSYDAQLSETTLSPKIAFGWQVDENTRLYTSLSQGYNPAGYTVVPTSSGDFSNGYDAETSLNAELGWRTSLLDNSLEFNGAFYWIKTDDLQSLVGDIGEQVTENLGEALSKGIELAFTYYPTKELTLNLAGTFGKSTYESDTDDLKGNTLTYAPDTTAIVGFEYSLPQAWFKGDLSIASQAHYFSTIYFDTDNSSSQDAYTLVDFSINYAYNENLSLSLFSNNLTDKTYTTYNNNAFGISTYGTGREVGLKANYSW